MTFIQLSKKIAKLEEGKTFLEYNQSNYARETDEFCRYADCIDAIQSYIDYLRYIADYEIINPA